MSEREQGPILSRRRFLKVITTLGLGASVLSVEAEAELKRGTNAGIIEWGKSLIVKRGSYKMEPGEDLIVFSDAIVTGDVTFYSPSAQNAPFSLEIADKISELSNVGNLLIVNSQLRINATYGAFVEYNPGKTEEEFLASKLEQISKPVNSANGYDGIVVWRFSNVNGISTFSADGIYLTKEQRFIPSSRRRSELDKKP